MEKVTEGRRFSRAKGDGGNGHMRFDDSTWPLNAAFELFFHTRWRRWRGTIRDDREEGDVAKEERTLDI